MVEMIGNRFVPVVFYVSKVFFEVDIKGASSFADAEFGAFGAMSNVVRLAVELFGDVYLGFRSLDIDSSTDEGAHFAFSLVARSGS